MRHGIWVFWYPQYWYSGYSREAGEGRREKKKVRSGAVTLRWADRRGLFCIISQQIGDSSGCSRIEIRLADLEDISHEAISEARSHPLNAFALAGAAAFCQCTP